MPSTLDVSSLEEAVAKTVKRMKGLNAEKQELKKELTAARRKLATAEKKLKKAQSENKTEGKAQTELIEEVRPRLEKLEADLSALLPSA